MRVTITNPKGKPVQTKSVAKASPELKKKVDQELETSKAHEVTDEEALQAIEANTREEGSVETYPNESEEVEKDHSAGEAETASDEEEDVSPAESE